ncbi:MAG TPA: class I SAM-dependent methyltransferase [Tepidisphaeraceae bacterium]|nr:class I SAM-dependent methyltransferase [Tepidisphaeraceae bacterium]
MTESNRYAKDWDEYSRRWDRQFAVNHVHLGDEWNQDAGGGRRRDDFFFSMFAEPFLVPEVTVLEVGPGGGKWTVRIAPRAKKLIALDVSQEMLDRARRRCEEEKISNVEFLLANGRDFLSVPDATIDFFFSFDVFVHLTLEDTFAYVQEMNRILKSGGRAICHHAISAPAIAWDRVEAMNDWYRGGKHTIGQYFYHTPESLRRMYEHCGLSVAGQFIEKWHCVCLIEKPAGSLLPRLEELLAKLGSPQSDDQAARDEVIAALRSLPNELAAAMKSALDRAATSPNAADRRAAAAQLREIWRGTRGGNWVGGG